MCIRDSGIPVRIHQNSVGSQRACLNLSGNVRRYPSAVFQRASIKAVSYTHLDVYKRQASVAAGQVLTPWGQGSVTLGGSEKNVTVTFNGLNAAAAAGGVRCV